MICNGCKNNIAEHLTTWQSHHSHSHWLVNLQINPVGKCLYYFHLRTKELRLRVYVICLIVDGFSVVEPELKPKLA